MFELKCPWTGCRETRPSRARLATHMFHAHRSVLKEEPTTAVCRCGRPIIKIDEQEPVMWSHTKSFTPGAPRCRDTRPADVQPSTDLGHEATRIAAGLPVDAPVTTPASVWRTSVRERLDEAGKDIAHLASQVTDINRRMDNLNETDPAAIRRQVLSDVWDRLYHENEINAMIIVGQMLREGKPQNGQGS